MGTCSAEHDHARSLFLSDIPHTGTPLAGGCTPLLRGQGLHVLAAWSTEARNPLGESAKATPPKRFSGMPRSVRESAGTLHEPAKAKHLEVCGAPLQRSAPNAQARIHGDTCGMQ